MIVHRCLSIKLNGSVPWAETFFVLREESNRNVCLHKNIIENINSNYDKRHRIFLGLYYFGLLGSSLSHVDSVILT